MTISAIVSSATLRVLENGALKTGTPLRCGGVEVDLVGADAEAADRHQPVGRLDHVSGELRARADAEQVHAAEGLLQRRRHRAPSAGARH